MQAQNKDKSHSIYTSLKTNEFNSLEIYLRVTGKSMASYIRELILEHLESENALANEREGDAAHFICHFVGGAFDGEVSRLNTESSAVCTIQKDGKMWKGRYIKMGMLAVWEDCPQINTGG